MTVSCWASRLGGCSDQQSGEHIVSAGLFDAKIIGVEGFPWCETAARPIGPGSLTANILCTTHNSLLSPVDSEAIRFQKMVAELHRLALVRTKLGKQMWHVVEHHVDGWLLERWFIKTTINMAIVAKLDDKWYLAPQPVNDPPELLTRVAFGLIRLDGPMGLYISTSEEQRLRGRGTIAEILTSFVSTQTTKRLAGALYDFSGYQFSIWLAPVSPNPLGVQRRFGPPWDGANFIHRMPGFRQSNAGFVSQTLTFHW